MNVAQNSFLLLLRNEFRLYLRGGIAKGASLVFLIIGQVVLHLFALTLVWGSSKVPVISAPNTGLFMLSGALLAMLMLMTSRALASAVQALYTRGDIDLLLASPVDRRAVTGVRMGAVALTVAMEVALLVWPFANMFVLFGHFVWFKAYLLVPAMAMLATSIGLALTLLSFRTLGPRRTRVAVQVLAVLVGMGIMLVVYVPRMLSSAPGTGFRPGGNPNPFASSMEMLARSDGYRELLMTPAQWVMQGYLPTLAFVVATAGVLALTIHLAGDRIVSAMTAVTVGGGRKTSSTAPGTPRFHRGFRTIIVLKELKLIARDPYMIAQLLRQGVFVLPTTFLLWRMNNGAIPLPWVSVIVLAAGFAGPLSWLTITAEDAPDLLASAPVSRAGLIRAKVVAALLPVLPVCIAPALFLTWSHPWFAFCTSFCALAAALCATLINMSNPVARRRDSFKMRHKGNGGRGFLEVVSLIFWTMLAIGLAWGGKALLAWR